MNTKKQTTTLLIRIFCTLIIAVYSVTGNAQSETEISEDFSITVMATGTSEIELECTGCAWTKLSYNINSAGPQAINAYGMDSNDTLDKESIILANFLFMIEKKEGNYIFKGLGGTDWKELSFDCTEVCNWTVDKSGVTKK